MTPSSDTPISESLLEYRESHLAHDREVLAAVVQHGINVGSDELLPESMPVSFLQDVLKSGSVQQPNLFVGYLMAEQTLGLILHEMGLDRVIKTLGFTHFEYGLTTAVMPDTFLLKMLPGRSEQVGRAFAFYYRALAAEVAANNQVDSRALEAIWETDKDLKDSKARQFLTK